MGERRSAQGDADERLVSWKAIAAYLGVSVRTAQKWERERALPVHRMPGRRATVFSTVAELDAWAAAGGRDRAAWNGSRRKWAIPVLASVLLVMAGVSYFTAFTAGSGPSSWDFRAGALVILDEGGDVVWQKELPPQPSNRLRPGESSHQAVQIADLDDDGRNEVVVGYSTDQPPESRVDCYSADGELRWSFRPGRPVHTAAEEFSPLFDFRALALVPGPEPQIAVASVHAVAPPSQVALLSPRGDVTAEYWHFGYLTELAVGDVDRDGDPELLAGGMNHAEEAAELVVLDPDHMNGASQEPDEFQILGLGPPVEELRLLFPHTCLAEHVDDARPRVSGIVVGPDDLAVHVEEVRHRYGFVCRLRYPDLRLADVQVGTAVRRAHDELYKLGVIDHRWGLLDTEALQHIRVLAAPLALAAPSG